MKSRFDDELGEAESAEEQVVVGWVCCIVLEVLGEDEFVKFCPEDFCQASSHAVMSAKRPLDDVVAERFRHATANRTARSRHEVVALSVGVDDVLQMRQSRDVSELCAVHRSRVVSP